MGDRIRYKGRFIKKKVLDKKLKIKKALREKKQVKDLSTNTRQTNLCEGIRMVDLKFLGEKLKCVQCYEVLCLDNIVHEQHLGLNSILNVRCIKCDTISIVPTGKVHSTAGNKFKYSDINTAIVLGAVHAGYGCTGLNKILACANIPTISPQLFKRYEREVGPAIEEAAKESCKRAAKEERQLVYDNIDKLCQLLPQEIVQEIYPNRAKLRAAINHSNENNNTIYDSVVGEVVNIIVSYDMGWSKRGNGKSYDSLNGYGTIIGFLSGKILDYAARIRKCKFCDLGRKKDDHDCRKNFEGSAKAMEASAGADLVNNSSILKETNLAARVLVGDEDSCTIASVRQGNFKTIFKLSDLNHLKKNFSKELWKMTNFKEIKKDSIAHIKKCFNYALAQNVGNSSNLAKTIRHIPDHMYNNHENCGAWCSRSNGSGNQTILLTNPSLFDKLSALCEKYAASAHKFSIPASSQGNESFNNIMAHKSPKNICYSRSESSSYRLASSVCSKNDGDSCIVEIRKKLQLSPGQHTSFYAELSDSKRKKRALNSKLPSAKKRRIIVKQEREKLRKKNENSEGVQYKSNCGLSQDYEDSESFDESLLKGPDIQVSAETCSLVFFDLETSGFRKSDEILQIAASCEGRKFSVYINPTNIIDEKASAHTGLKNINGDLYFHGNKVESLPLKKALRSFLVFLKMSPKPCLLVAHNVTFDQSHLLRSILKCSMVPNFSKIAGFSDSLSLFKKHFTSNKTPGEYKLSELAKKHLNVNSDDKFHEALYDVEILEELVSLTDNKYLFESSKSYRKCLNHLNKLKKTASGMDCLSPLKGVLSGHILKKMASQDIKYQDLINKYENGGVEELIKFSKEPGSDNKPKITKDKRVIDKLCKFFTEKV